MSPLRVLLWFALVGAAPCAAADAAALAEATRQLQAGRYEPVIETARRAREEEPREEQWWRLEGEALRALGRYAELGELAAEGLARAPGSLRLRLLQREAALFGGSEADPEISIREIMQAINFTSVVRGREYARSSEFQAAVGEASLLAGLEPRLALENFLRPAQQARPASRDAFRVAGQLALEKRDFALAARTFEAGLQHAPEDPDLLCGLAASFRNGDRTQLVALAQRALSQNPRHVPTHLLLADHLIDAERRDTAREHLDQALAVNPHVPEAHALRAVLAHLERDAFAARRHRDQALARWANNPAVDHLIGRKLSQNYQFAEGATAQRRALGFDSRFTPARVQLAQDLLRLGEEEEGWQLAAQAHEEDAYNVEAFNLTTLQDRLDQFVMLASEHFRVRMDDAEAPIYGDRVLELLERAHTRVTERYGLELEQPTLVEIYADPRDFAVRTFGMPDVGGFLGVCFGPVFTINSPASGRSNWEAVLWHEFVHVVTLTATHNRMPRWLSEGISVFEERQEDPRWGQRMTLDYRNRILAGRMQPISRMSAAFLEAKDGADTQFAYFQSGLVVEFLVERGGFERLQRLLRSLAQGREANAALEEQFGPLARLDADFAAHARSAAQALGGDLDLRPAENSIERLLAQASPMLRGRVNYHQHLEQAQAAMDREDWGEARKALAPLTGGELYLPGNDNPHVLLARVCAELGDTAGERAAWERVAAEEADALPAVTRLLEMSRATDDWPAVVHWSEAWLAIHPLASTPWRALLDAHEQLESAAAAARAGRSLLRLDPPDLPRVHLRVATALATAEPATARRHVLMALEEAPRFRAAYELLAQLPPAAALLPASPDT